MTRMQHNPYSPPESDVDFAIDPPGAQHLAGKSRRFFNYLIDILLLQMLLKPLLRPLLIMPLLVRIARTNGDYVILFAVSLLISLLIFLLYYIACESLFGRTVGKLITGTRVVAVSGQRPTFLQIVLRALVRHVPFEPFSFLGDEPGWHDRWSGTQVVLVRRLRTNADNEESVGAGSVSGGHS